MQKETVTLTKYTLNKNKNLKIKHNTKDIDKDNIKHTLKILSLVIH